MEYAYKVVSGNTSQFNIFYRTVQDYVGQGYSPAGGVSAVTGMDAGYDLIYQAMYKPVVAEAVVGGASGGAEASQGGSGRSRSRKTRRR
jgi:hypothetical protein